MSQTTIEFYTLSNIVIYYNYILHLKLILKQFTPIDIFDALCYNKNLKGVNYEH